jgi:hypothetical protein
MSVFDRLDRLTSRAVDRVYAQTFVCRPMIATPNGRAAVDITRSEWEGNGVFEEAPAFHAIEIGNRNRSGNDFRSLATGASFELSVDLQRYRAADATRQGDSIEIGDRCFEVSEVQRDRKARIVFGLIKVG